MPDPDREAPAQKVEQAHFPWRFRLPLFVGSALNPINSSMIATALVPIADQVGASLGATSVLIASLYLASAVAQPAMGRLAEALGPRRVFVAGVGLVLAGGLIGGLGRDLPVLTVARVLIGIGTAAGYPTAMILVRRRAAAVGLTEPPGRVLGGLTVTGQATAVLGLPLGGLLVGAFGWQAVFFVNVPLALLAWPMLAAWVPPDPPPTLGGGLGRLARAVDIGGMAGFVAATTSLLVFVLSLPQLRAVALAIGIGSAIGLVLWELHARAPFVDVRLLASSPALSFAFARIALTLFGMYSILYGVAQWIEAGRGQSPAVAGFSILPMTAVAIVAATLAAGRTSVRRPLLAAAACALAGSGGLLLAANTSSILGVVAVTVLFGVAVGAGTVGNQAALYVAAPAARIGTAAGFFRTFGYVGAIGSAAVTGVVFSDAADDRGLRTIAAILTVASIGLAVATLADRSLSTRAARR
ncbi:MAG: MFS transporter [Solirubrobacterales bacterium]